MTSNPQIRVPHINYYGILPVIIMMGGAFVLLAATSLVKKPMRVRVGTIGTVLISLTALAFALVQWKQVVVSGHPYTTVKDAVVVDGFSIFITILVTVAMALTALVADGYLRREGTEGPELHVLALLSASGAILMAQANDLIIIFLGLEILSIALYVLAAFNHRRAASGEAALKYFILGAFSSAIFLYGIALTYGATGSTNLVQISDFLARNTLLTSGLLLAGIGLLIVGFAFKVSAVPFHMWTPDVYQGSPSPVVGFMAAVAKAGAFAAMLRVLVSGFGLYQTDWKPIIYALAVVSLLLGSVVALRQRDVKRMMAYSSINHAGFILLGVEAATRQGVSASLYYLFAYMFMVIGTFAIFSVLGRKSDGDHDIARYRGLASRQPLLALALAILLLAQAGAPFTTGLWAKLQVVLSSVSSGAVPLAVIAMVTAAIAAFFYLRVAVMMYTPRRADGAVPGLEATDVADEDPMEPVDDTAPNPNQAEIDAHLHHTPDDAVLTAAHTDGKPMRRSSLWTGADAVAAGITKINADLLFDHEVATSVHAVPGAEDAPVDDEVPILESEPVPAFTSIALGICVGVTVLFGVWPEPLIEFANKATLLFFPH